jgi:hypothetical protein
MYLSFGSYEEPNAVAMLKHAHTERSRHDVRELQYKAVLGITASKSEAPAGNSACILPL